MKNRSNRSSQGRRVRMLSVTELEILGGHEPVRAPHAKTVRLDQSRSVRCPSRERRVLRRLKREILDG